MSIHSNTGMNCGRCDGSGVEPAPAESGEHCGHCGRDLGSDEWQLHCPTCGCLQRSVQVALDKKRVTELAEAKAEVEWLGYALEACDSERVRVTQQLADARAEVARVTGWAYSEIEQNTQLFADAECKVRADLGGKILRIGQSLDCFDEIVAGDSGRLTAAILSRIAHLTANQRTADDLLNRAVYYVVRHENTKQLIEECEAYLRRVPFVPANQRVGVAACGVAAARSLREVITDVVYGRLAEWGTTAKVVNDGHQDKPLRVLLNEQCDPLIDELTKETSAWSGETWKPYEDKLSDIIASLTAELAQAKAEVERLLTQLADSETSVGYYQQQLADSKAEVARVTYSRNP